MANNYISSLEGHDIDIVFIVRVGSKALLGHGEDEDVLVCCMGYPKDYERVKLVDGDETYDVLFANDVFLYKAFDYTNQDSKVKSFRLYNYFHAISDKVYGEPLEYNMLLQKDDYLRFIKEHYSDRYSMDRLNSRMGKMFVHYYTILKIFENDKIEITQEMKDDIEILYKCDDSSLPIILNVATTIENIN